MVCENRHKKVCQCPSPEFIRKKCPHCSVIFNVCVTCKGKQIVAVKHKHPQHVALHKEKAKVTSGNVNIIKSPIVNSNPALANINIIKTPTAKSNPASANNIKIPTPKVNSTTPNTKMTTSKVDPVTANIKMSASKVNPATANVNVIKTPTVKGQDGQGPIIVRNGLVQVNKNNNKPFNVIGSDWNKNIKPVVQNNGVLNSTSTGPKLPSNNMQNRPLISVSNMINGPQNGLFTINQLKDPKNKMNPQSEDYFQDIKEVKTKGKKESTSYRQDFSRNKDSRSTDDLWPKELAYMSEKPTAYENKYNNKSRKNKSHRKKAKSSTDSKRKYRKNRDIYRKRHKSKS